MKESKWSAASVRTLSLLLLSGALTNDSLAAPGDLDLSFDPGSGLNGGVRAMALQPDGKIIITGDFTMVRGLVSGNIARLNADGTGDASFSFGTGATEGFDALALQSDGKVLVGHQGGIFRLNANGRVDTNFVPPFLTDFLGTIGRGVSAIALQPDGKILIGGTFGAINFFPYAGIARLNADGSHDPTFDTRDGLKAFGYDPFVDAIVVQTNGQVIAVGSFWGYRDAFRTNIVRIHADGNVDYGFDPRLRREAVVPLALQPDGKVLVGQGRFGGISRLNADGSLDSTFNPGAAPSGDGQISSVALQSDGKMLVGGNFTEYNGVSRDRMARLNSDGSLDGSFDPGLGSHAEIGSVLIQPNGKVLAAGTGNPSSLNLIRLNADGGSDPAFSAVTAGGGLDDQVMSLAVQPDGKLLIGGSFAFVSGESRNGLARLNVNGSLDTGFDPATATGALPLAIALQPDGKVLIGGYGPLVEGTNGVVARLNADGSVDGSFAPIVEGSGIVVRSIAKQPDGKVLIGGHFETVNGTNRYGIARLNFDGTLDSTFNSAPEMPRWSQVYSIAVQPDGKILIAGDVIIDSTNGVNNIARLNSDGSLDDSFQGKVAPYFEVGGGNVTSVTLQPDGRALIGGYFETVNGSNRYAIARLNANGSLDGTFNPGPGSPDSSQPTNGPFSGVLGIAVQTDGKVLVAGAYYLGVGAFPDGYVMWIYRLNSDGSLDHSFRLGRPVGGVNAFASQADGSVLIGGDFLQFDGAIRPYVARLYGDFARLGLSITRSNSSTVVSWPAVFGNFQLQENTNVSLANGWSAVGAPRSTNNSFISVALPTTGTRKFLRLKSP